MQAWLYALDRGLLDAIAGLRCSFFDRVMPTVSIICNHGEIWLAFACALILWKRDGKRRAGVTIVMALAFGFVVGNLILKPLIGRVRPFEAMGVTLELIAAPLDASFPSGHTLSSFAAAVVLMAYDRRMGIPALLLAGIIAFSRLYLYVHYPSDVLAGAILGCLSAYAALRVMKNREKDEVRI